MGITETQRAALTQMLDTAADLDRWRLRAHRVEEPERGSELAVRLALDAIKAKQLYPSSHFTVLRGALVGASQAVYILGPQERDVRRERGLTVLTEMHVQMEKYYDFLGRTELNAVDRASLRDQQVWLNERRDDVRRLTFRRLAIIFHRSRLLRRIFGEVFNSGVTISSARIAHTVR
ncbi:hypothetical protein [Paenarthrobacter sp. 4246]|uniref:hypothetical protein n=1 Tax=Paenarthrobacter sp. 4246 TaxID=3156456 RepID=UPI0033908784